MIALFSGIVSVATTAIGVFSEGVITSLLAYSLTKNVGKPNISIKK